jgi:hypothetical protein
MRFQEFKQISVHPQTNVPHTLDLQLVADLTDDIGNFIKVRRLQQVPKVRRVP